MNNPQSAHAQHDEGPWYRQFWAWFVFAPLIVVVIASLSMVVLAFKTKQDVVVDDYYKVGKMINQSFAPEQKARELGVNVELGVDSLTGEIWLEGIVPAGSTFDDHSLLLNLSHPVKASNDRFITLKKQSDKRWRADISTLTDGRWYVRLSSLDAAGQELWRLKGELDLPKSSRIRLQ